MSAVSLSCWFVGAPLGIYAARNGGFSRTNLVFAGKVCLGIAVGNVCVNLLVKRIYGDEILRSHVWSCIVDWFQRRLNPGMRARIQRTLELYREGVRAGHPHAKAATNRNSATVAMTNTARALGLDPYVISPSMREQNVAGNRSYYQLNDYLQRPRNDTPGRKSCLIMTDIDYYIDWSYWLSFGVPVLFYSFVPESVGGSVPEGVFSITNNVVETTISNGGIYRHEVWDYNRDSLWHPCCGNTLVERISHWLGVILGVWKHGRVCLFSVDQFQVGEHRRIISLVPFSQGPDWIVWGQEASRLTRLKTQVGVGPKKFNLLRVLRSDGPYIAVSREGDVVSAVLPEGKFVGASIRYKSSTSKNISDVVRFVGTSCDVTEAAIIAAYLSGVQEAEPRTVMGAGTIAEHYLCIASDVVEDGKKYARRYCPKPLSREAAFPVEGHNNEEICILKRIEEPQRRSSALMAKACPRMKGTPPARYATYASEFVYRVVVGQERSGRPWMVDEVVKQQSLPRQRERSARRVMDFAEKFVVQAFQKREAYSTPNDPRNISTVPTTHTLRLSSYTLAFKIACLKGQPWYMPGRTPLEIATAIMDLAAENESLIEGDYSRFDGSISRWLRVNVEFACYLAWCHPDESDELNDLLQAELSAKAFTKLGMKYCPGGSRLSGSPLTTDGNTLINAFVGYATLRDHGVDADFAFTKLGLCYGDDSLLTGRVSHPTKKLGQLVSVASAVGLQLKAREVPTGGSVMFLSRCFVNPWVTPDSLTDPLRTLLKIHTTVDTVGELARCGFDKASAYLVTDSKTPFISQWCRAYLRALGKTFEVEREMYAIDLPYWYTIPEFRTAPWPQDSIPDCWEAVARFLDCRVDELRSHCDRLDAFAGTVEELPFFDVVQEPVKVACVLGGEVRTPGEPYCDVDSSSVSGSVNVKDGKLQKDSKTSCSETPSGVPPVHGDGHSTDGTSDRRSGGGGSENRGECARFSGVGPSPGPSAQSGDQRNGRSVQSDCPGAQWNQRSNQQPSVWPVYGGDGRNGPRNGGQRNWRRGGRWSGGFGNRNHSATDRQPPTSGGNCPPQPTRAVR
jgi:hypothetical protein